MLTGLLLLGGLGTLSMLPPYVGPPLGLELEVADNVEVVDHIVAGGTVVLCSFLAAWLLWKGRIGTESPVLMGAVALAVLGAVWQTTSHVPLVLDGGGPQTPWGTVLFHSVLGPIVTVIALGLLWRILSEEPEEERQAPA
jgi:hypothetical protein